VQLPNALEAAIEDTKLAGYLLNPDHPRGRSKANYFLRFGYTADTLRTDLLHLARTSDATEQGDNGFGIVWSIIGTITSPTGDLLKVETIWQVDHGTDRPKLITAHPV
jgi:hypothetical protein